VSADVRRVAYLCADGGVPVFGRKGCSIHVQEVISAMLARGAVVDLFANRFDGDAPRALRAVRAHALPRTEGDDLETRERVAYLANRHTRSLVAAHGPYDFVYERYSLWSYAAIEDAAARGSATILEVNAPLIEEQAEHRGLVNRALAEDVARRVFSAAGAIVAVSDEVAAYVRSRVSDPARVHVIPNGVDPIRFAVRRKRREDGRFTIGFVGTMKPWHGVPVLIDAFERLHRSHPQMHLLLVGDGTERQKLAEDIAARGLGGAVTMTGAVERDAIPNLIASMDVAVAPYPKLERFYFSPLKVLEYMAAGAAVVASDIGQLSSLIEHERTGLLVPAGDVDALVVAIERSYSDAEERQRLATAARARALANHTWDAVVSRIFKLSRQMQRATQNAGTQSADAR
jgi:glycosyltransferase involved in cell wall biosynthesis